MAFINDPNKFGVVSIPSFINFSNIFKVERNWHALVGLLGVNAVAISKLFVGMIIPRQHTLIRFKSLLFPIVCVFIWYKITKNILCCLQLFVNLENYNTKNRNIFIFLFVMLTTLDFCVKNFFFIKYRNCKWNSYSY